MAATATSRMALSARAVARIAAAPADRALRPVQLLMPRTGLHGSPCIRPVQSSSAQRLVALDARPARVVSTSASASSFAPPEAPATSSQVEKIQPEADSWQVKILYDGDCPICMREVDFLQERNKKYSTLKFVDISDSNYSPEENAGVTFEEAMGHIHGITRDGEVLTGVEAFRKFYEVIGLGWVYAATKLKPVQAVADAVYEVWAKYRLPLSGRPSLDAILEERRIAKEGLKGCNEEEECVVDW